MVDRRNKILILNGPNINLIGIRETNVYGGFYIEEVNHELSEFATNSCIDLEIFQSNYEGELITKTQDVIENPADFLILNPAGYTHTSIAWRDALLAINVPFIEVHISNVYAREEFRNKSFFSDIAVGVITGLGENSYKLAMIYAVEYLLNKE